MIQYYADSDVNGNIIGFYNDDIWDVTKIPITAIEITEEQWQDCIANQGKYIVQAGALELAPPPTQAEIDAENAAIQKQPPSIEDRVKATEDAILALMGL
jgi:hypothetical protein